MARKSSYIGATQFNNFKNCLFLEKMAGTGRQYSVEFEDQQQVAREIEAMTGDILGNFFNEDGDIYAYPGGAHASSPKLHTLRQVNQVICAAYGIPKARSILAAARLGFFKTLITNEETAQALWRQLSDGTAVQTTETASERAVSAD